MGADTEAIDSGAQSGLLNHVVGFHTKRAVASKSREEEANKIVNSKSMSENTNNMENSEVKGGTEDGDKKRTVGVEKPMKDEWEFDDLEEDDAIDGKQENTEDRPMMKRYATQRTTKTQIGTQEEKMTKMVKRSSHQMDRRRDKRWMKGKWRQKQR